MEMEIFNKIRNALIASFSIKIRNGLIASYSIKILWLWQYLIKIRNALIESFSKDIMEMAASRYYDCNI